MNSFLLIGILIVVSGFSFDDDRDFLNDLTNRRFVFENEYEMPHLLVRGAARIKVPVKEAYLKFKDHFSKHRLDFKGRFGTTGRPVSDLNESTFSLPIVTITGEQLDGLRSCSLQKCLSKLLDDPEKKRLMAAPDKAKAYQQLIIDRIQGYLTTGELIGYEDRASNSATISKVVGGLTEFNKVYPAIKNFFYEGSWKKDQRPKNLVDSFLRQEMVVIAPDRMQPILRIGDVYEFDFQDRYVWVELHIYTNHYFDSSLKIVELLPEKKGSLIILTDIMEIDELKKSGLIRTLFKGNMVSAVEKYQKDEMIELGVEQ